MINQTEANTVVTSQVLLKPALEDLKRARPDSRPGDKVSLVSGQWQETFIMTSRYGWLRLPN